ncbi:hypothetical protein [Microbacterium sp. NIBRBAC000506063]|uniref:hypothetical protein n=1 Tax=Microbacterium sp. NIBRBAC000506063 TaxID=2734618 RepID=UPI001BB65EB8|nr:hypothetical protein [Microbacterium sp. NIBRBAC000506063]QTV79304.1 hypothetical protein KAE78_09820 [Microbacterium sp. NIBRBAC000506063]
MTEAARRGALACITIVVILATGAGLGLAVGDVLSLDATSRPDLDAPLPRDPAMAWMARGLLVLALAWVLIGILAARTQLVRRPGAAAARATWLASTRPGAPGSRRWACCDWTTGCC